VIPFLSAFTVDESTLPAQKDAALGFFGGANWAPDMKNPQSEAFVKAYEAAFNGVPGTYAMQGYDAALLIDAAIKAAGGKLDDKNAIRAGLRKADFKSLRGDFKMGKNHYPIQDFYVVQVVKRPDGKFATSIRQKVFDDYVDVYAKDCQMPAN
jgi:branched-chain amino acid transport system substrate-binding protein